MPPTGEQTHPRIFDAAGVWARCSRAKKPPNFILSVQTSKLLDVQRSSLRNQKVRVLVLPARSEFLAAIAGTYAQLGEAERALAILDRALTPGADPSMEHLLIEARAKRDLEQLDEAKRILRSVPAAEPKAAIKRELELAQVEYSAGEYEQMRARLESLTTQVPASETELLEDVRYWQAVSLSATNQFQESIEVLDDLMAIQQRSGQNAMRVQRTRQRLVNELIRVGDHERALKLQREATQFIAHVYGQESFQFRVTGSNQAFLLATQDKFADALPLIDSALTATEERFGSNHRRTAMLTFDAAMLHEESPDGPARALTLYGQAIDRSAVAFDTNHPNRFLFHIAYAFFALESGDIETTLKLCEAADAIARNNETVREWDLFPALQALHSAARWRGAASPEAERDVRRRFATLASLLAENKLGPQTLDKVRALQTDLEKLGMRFVATEKL